MVRYYVRYNLSRLPDHPDGLIVSENRIVNPAEAAQIIGAPQGKAAFMLLPDGELRLRVFVGPSAGYQFFPLNYPFEAFLQPDSPQP